MLQRCYDERCPMFRWYGARGIRVCDRWRNDFWTFVADVGERPADHTLDRWPDNDGNYEPGNVRWATRSEQFKNRRKPSRPNKPQKSLALISLPEEQAEVAQKERKTNAKHKLNAQWLAAAPAGRYCDGANLWCHKDSQDAGRWVFRYRLHGEKHSIGLGSTRVFSLKEARAKADKLLKMQKSGVDPLAEKRAGIAKKKLTAASALTFRMCAEKFIEDNRTKWDCPQSERQFTNTLKKYAYRILDGVPVANVDTALVLKVLEQPVRNTTFWVAHSETADRVRARLEAILGWSTVRGYRSGENPARWKNHLEHVLPHLTKQQNVTHFPALPYAELPRFMSLLRQQTDIASRALEYSILVAGRPGETQGLTWQEVNFNAKMVIIPRWRMKGRSREHRIALSSRALQILREMYGDGDKPADALVFSEGGNRPLHDHALITVIRRLGCKETAHGFRSTFIDWATENTDHPRDARELAVAHRVGDNVTLAYQRGDLLKLRYKLMEDWASFAASEAVQERHAAVA